MGCIMAGQCPACPHCLALATGTQGDVVSVSYRGPWSTSGHCEGCVTTSVTYFTGLPFLLLLQSALCSVEHAFREAHQHGRSVLGCRAPRTYVPRAQLGTCSLPAEPRWDQLCHACPWEHPDSREARPPSLDRTAVNLQRSMKLGNPGRKEDQKKI